MFRVRDELCAFVEAVKLYGRETSAISSLFVCWSVLCVNAGAVRLVSVCRLLSCPLLLLSLSRFVCVVCGCEWRWGRRRRAQRLHSGSVTAAPYRAHRRRRCRRCRCAASTLATRTNKRKQKHTLTHQRPHTDPLCCTPLHFIALHYDQPHSRRDVSARIRQGTTRSHSHIR